jgi:hypothetical protein
MPNHLRWSIELMNEIYGSGELRLGECSCSQCQENKKLKHFKVLAKKIYPEMTVLPYKYDREQNWGNTNPEWRYDSFVDQDKIILKKLDMLRTHNRRRIGQWKRYNKDYDFCVECGTAHRVEYLSTGSHYRNRLRVTGLICNVCAARYYRKCWDCDELVFKGGMYNVGEVGAGYEIHDYNYVCQECYETGWGECSRCNINYPTDSLVFWSSEAGAEVGTPEFVDTDLYPDARLLCTICKEDSKTTCQCCGKSMFTWDIRSNNEHDQLCAACYEHSKVIHSWEWKPPPKFKISKKNPKYKNDKLMYGVELEIEKSGGRTRRHQMAHTVLDFWGGDYLYVKEDATINEGIEIVTHPFSWQEYRERRKKWDQLLELIKTYHYGADQFENVGIHIHMTKKAFTRFHLYKFLTFIYSEPHRVFVEAIAQRSDHEYAMWCSSDGGDGIKANAKDKYNTSDERHSAVNLCGNNTIEVRIFASTIIPKLFHKNIEFLQSLFEFTQATKAKQITIPYYWRYLNFNQNSNRFRNLIEFIACNNTIEDSYSLTKKGTS